MTRQFRFATALLAGVATLALGQAAFAGPIIISGTDADDHGSANSGGWLFMKAALNNLAPSVTNGKKTIAVLGTDAGTQSANAINWAFSNSSLPAAGWSISFLNDAGIGSFFAGTGAVTTANTGLIYMDSGYTNISGGMNANEEATVGSNATNLNTFLTSGGGLFSQANHNLYLTALLPGIVVTTDTGSGIGTGITLTPAGTAAFPGLTNADLSTGPWHQDYAGNLGGLTVLGTGPDANGVSRNVILTGSRNGTSGGGGGITGPVPEPGTLALLASGVLPVGAAVLRRRRRAA